MAIENLESVVDFCEEVISPNSIMLLDPRGVIVGAESGVIYTPRPFAQDFPSEMRDWLEQNPDWPSRLNLERE